MSTRLALVVAASLAVGGVVAACGGGGGGAITDKSNQVAKAGSGAPEKKTIRFGIIQTPDYAPVEIAIKRGFFKQEGLDVTASVIPPGQAVPSLLGGSIDIGGVNWISFLLAVNHRIDLRVVSEADRGTPGYAQYLVAKSSGIKNLDGLVGKKVGVVATPGNCDVIPLDWLKRSGVKSGPKYVNLAVPDMPATIARGGVAAACVPEPTLTAVKGQFRSIFDLFAGRYQGFPIVGYMTTGKFAEQNPNTIGALRRGLAKATALITKDPAVVRDVLPSYTAITPAQAKTITLPAYATSIDPARIHAAAAMLERAGLVKGNLVVPIAAPPKRG